MTLAQSSLKPARVEVASIISVRNLTQRYGESGTPQSVLALEDISLDIKRGEFLTLLGPSGCGKSTLLNVIGGLLRPSEGSVSLDGTDIRAPMPNKVTFVFQESTLFPWYTVAENFGLAFKYQGIAKAEWADRTAMALKSVGMSEFSGHYPNQLSVGMRQRINLARGIAAGTEILLMDEPFAALDVQTRALMEQELLGLWQELGAAVLFVTHDLEEAVALSDRVILFTAGPQATIKGDYPVDLPRPRNVVEARFMPGFAEVYERVWQELRDEVMASYMLQQTQPGTLGRASS